MKMHYKVRLLSWESMMALAIAINSVAKTRTSGSFDWYVDNAFYRLWKGDRIIIDRNDPGEEVE